jgi:ankyrin repeat protein
MLSKLLAACPGAVSQKTKTGELPLHRLCRGCSFTTKAELNLLKTLLSTFKEGASVVDAVGNLPVHCAMISGKCPVEALEMLLDAYPEALNTREANVQRNLLTLTSFASSIDTLKYLLQRCLGLARIADRNGQLPFHAAARHSNVDGLKLLYDAYPDAIRMSTIFGELPLHIALLSYSRFPDPLSADADTIRLLLKLCPNAVNLQRPYTAAEMAALAVADDNAEEHVWDGDGVALTAYEQTEIDHVDDYIVRLLLQACPDADPERAKELNYAARRQLMFLAFSARTEMQMKRVSPAVFVGGGEPQKVYEEDERMKPPTTVIGITGSDFVYQLRRLMNVGEEMGLLRHIASYL